MSLVVGAVMVMACSAGVPEVPVGADGQRDPQLVLGREVYGQQCTRCHGTAGGGGRGPKLSEGRVVERYADVTDQFDVVANGRRGGLMPAFSGVLGPDEIDAVLRYTREVL